MPSGVESRAALVIRLSGEVGVVDSPKEETLDTLLDGILESVELILADLPWLMTRSGGVSGVILVGDTMGLLDCRPTDCGRGRGGEATDRAPLSTDAEVACGLSFDGDVGL